MNKKFVSALLLGSLVFTAGTFTACSDYDDDINMATGSLTVWTQENRQEVKKVNRAKKVLSVLPVLPEVTVLLQMPFITCREKMVTG